MKSLIAEFGRRCLVDEETKKKLQAIFIIGLIISAILLIVSFLTGEREEKSETATRG